MRIVKRTLSLVMTLAMLLCMIPAVTSFAADTNATEGTFTVCAMNVDGLPQKILFVSLNSDGPGSSGTKNISAKMATYGWDIIGVSEDFNYHSELMSSLSGYSSGTNRGGVSGLSNDTDGLNLIWKNAISVSGEKWVGWNDNYASGLFGTGNGADTMIDKGYRFYQATVAEGITVDVYILHMDADSDAEDIAARESQLNQLVSAIKASNNGNPIIVMGDTNCRYTRENLQGIFINGINADPRFTIQDAWIEHVRNGNYPVQGTDALVAVDKGGTYNYPEAEIVDKVFYINNTDSAVTISADYYQIATDFVDASGTALADHWPVVVQFTYSIPGAHEHVYAESQRTEAGCETVGEIVYSCECGDFYTEEIPATGHNYGSAVTKEPGCEEEGITTFTCGNCGDAYTEAIAAVGHNYSSAVTKEPGCEEEGITTFTCDNCGDNYTEAIAAVGHNYSSAVTKEPGCEEEGITTFTCGNCGDAYTEAIAAVGHNYSSAVTKEPGCEEEGITTFTCDNCGDNYTEAIAAVGHNFSSAVTKEPGCEEEGITTFTCGNCGDAYTEAIAAAGHNYSGTVTKEATCLDSGEKAFVCSDCDNSYTEVVPALGHAYTETVTKEATCLEAGEKMFVCSNCEDSYTEVLPASNHAYVEAVTKAATCENAGEKTFTCGNCEDSYTEVIPAIGHSYNGTLTQEATCEVAGVMTYTCENCSASYTEQIDAIGHSYTYAVTQEPTCEECGVRTYTCGNCSNEYIEAIAALGHNYQNGVCANCGKHENGTSGVVTLGEEVTTLTSGKKYVVMFSGSTGVFSMNTNGTALVAQSCNLATGDEVADEYIWTIEVSNGKYVFSTEIDGTVYYLYKTSTFTGSGYRLGLTANRSSATAWTLSTSSSSLRFYVQSGWSKAYLRYHNARLGWQASFSSAGLHIYEVIE